VDDLAKYGVGCFAGKRESYFDTRIEIKGGIGLKQAAAGTDVEKQRVVLAHVNLIPHLYRKIGWDAKGVAVYIAFGLAGFGKDKQIFP